MWNFGALLLSLAHVGLRSKQELVPGHPVRQKSASRLPFALQKNISDRGSINAESKGFAQLAIFSGRSVSAKDYRHQFDWS